MKSKQSIINGITSVCLYMLAMMMYHAALPLLYAQPKSQASDSVNKNWRKGNSGMFNIPRSLPDSTVLESGFQRDFRVNIETDDHNSDHQRLYRMKAGTAIPEPVENSR